MVFHILHILFIYNSNLIHLFHLQFCSRYVTPLIANLKKTSGEEISEGDVHLATGTLDTNTFEVVFVVAVVDDGNDHSQL